MAPGRCFEDGEFAKHGWTHTSVTHKRKPGQSVAYTLRRWITTKDGTKHDCLCGTQVIDGFWASLRREVGRTGVQTGEEDSTTRERLYKLVRVFQWHWWHLHTDSWPLFCALVRAARGSIAAPRFEILQTLLHSALATGSSYTHELCERK